MKRANSLDNENLPKRNCDNKFLAYLLVHSESPEFSSASPFYIQKGFQAICGSDPKSLKKLRSGDFLIEAANPIQSKCLMAAKTLGTIPITVSPHKTLNYSKGVLSESDLMSVSETEIVTELAAQGVVEAHRITIKRENRIIPTKHIILTFDSQTLPLSVKAGYLSCKIRPYIPKPLRCYKCQKFGHSNRACRSQETCSNCGSTDHITNCPNNAKCVNCTGNHPAYSTSCPTWIKEKQVQELKIKHKISYSEARKMCRESPGPTYASVTKSYSTNSTQTDLTIAPDQSFDLKKYLKEKTQSATSTETRSDKTSNSVKNTQTSSFKINLPDNKYIKNKSSKPITQKLNELRQMNVEDSPQIKKSNKVDPAHLFDMDIDPGLQLPKSLLPKPDKKTFRKNKHSIL